MIIILFISSEQFLEMILFILYINLIKDDIKIKFNVSILSYLSAVYTFFYIAKIYVCILAALLALKRKKRLEGQLRQIDGSLTTIEFQRESLESAATNNAVLSAMRDAKDALKKAQGGLDVDEVHDLMDEIVEQNEVGNEIAEAISRPAFGLNEIDEDELNDELEALTQEGIDDQLTKLEDRASELPEVPSDKIPVGKLSIYYL